MPNYTYTPTAEFGNRVRTIFGMMVQSYAAQGQILPHVQQFMENEFNNSYSQILSSIMSHYALGTVPSDQQIQSHLQILINLMLSRYAETQRTAYAAPRYGYQQPYNPSLAQGGMQQNASLFSPPPAPTPAGTPSSGFYANPGNTPPPQPVQTALPPLAQPIPQPVNPTQANPITNWRDTLAKTDMSPSVIYRPPVLHDSSTAGQRGTDLDLGWGTANVVQYEDVDTKEELDLVKVDAERGFTSPKAAVEATLDSIRSATSTDKFVDVNYVQLQAYDVPRITSEDAVAKMKEATANVPVNSKYSYLKTIDGILGDLKSSLKEQLESIFIREFNSAAMYGALYDSSVSPEDSSFRVNTIKELLSYLDMDITVDARTEKIRSQSGFRDRLSVVAKNTILRAVKGIQVSDPNTPEGLKDYIDVYGNIKIGDHPIKDIGKIRAQSMATNTKGEKTQDAISAADTLTRMVEFLNRYTVIRISDKNVVFTTLPINGMIQGEFIINSAPQDYAGPGDPVSHCEFFTMVMKKSTDQRTFTMFFYPCSNVLISYTGVKTSDNWIRLMPVRMM